MTVILFSDSQLAYTKKNAAESCDRGTGQAVVTRSLVQSSRLLSRANDGVFGAGIHAVHQKTNFAWFQLFGLLHSAEGSDRLKRGGLAVCL